MSEENSNVDTDINLDDFAAELFGQKEAAPEQASPEKPEDTVEQDTTPEPSDEGEPDDDTVATDDEPEAEPEPVKKKNRYQERIDELTADKREFQRTAETERQARVALEAKVAELSKKFETKDTAPASKGPDAPKPDDLKEDGTEKYPLGEYDPQYIRDLTRHTIMTESMAVREREEQERVANELKQQETALITSWNEKLASAETDYPDIKEKAAMLEDTFRGIEPALGKYLAATIMSMEFGPGVLNYLSDNIDEAKKIVTSGATKAVIALGRIEGKFADAAAEKQLSKPRVTKAPAPPPTNKGSAVAVAEVPDDTEDLDAFSLKLFGKKK